MISRIIKNRLKRMVSRIVNNGQEILNILPDGKYRITTDGKYRITTDGKYRIRN